jgi:hypothetical protein
VDPERAELARGAWAARIASVVSFTRGSARCYLVALAAWAGGFVAMIVVGYRGGASASGGAVAILLLCLFASDAAMLALAVDMSRDDAGFPLTSAPSPFGWQGRWLLVLGLRWMFLLYGVAAPTAIRVLRSDR